MNGTLLANRYEIVREVGRGGMGVVYLARDTVLERDVAVKMLPPAMLSPEAEDRFRREARVVGRMDHPGIVPLHDLLKQGDSVFLVMPFVPGISLRTMLKERNMSIGDAIEVGIQVAEALEHSHGHGVVHRDIKPENILVERDESGQLRVRVADFGVAAAEFEDRVTKSGVIVGTGAYLSPEQVSESPVDGRTDIFAMGVVLYECLTGTLPFAGSGASLYYKIAFSGAKAPRSIRPDIPADVESVVLRCLEKAAERRPATARDLAIALRACRADSLAATSPGRPALTVRAVVSAASEPAPFVNREKELEALLERQARTEAGEAHLVLVAGVTGIGKTRLLERLESEATARGVRVLHGRFFDRDRSFPYQAFCDAFQEYLVSESLSTASAPPDFADLMPELTTLFPALAELHSVRTTTSGTVERPTTATGVRAFVERTEIFEVLARALARIGSGRPLMLLLEDLHASDVSVEALQYILRRCSATPTLVVASYRSDDVDAAHPVSTMLERLRGDRRFEQIRVGPLDREAQRRLVSSIVGDDVVDGVLANRIYEVTEGNPFFTTELVRALMDSGALQQDADGWHFTGSSNITPESLPDTIQQAVDERIRRLTETQRDVLAIASVLGRSFVYRDLESLASDVADLEATVDWLIDAGYLVEVRESRGERIAFSSAIVRDALYARLARRRRRALHRTHAQRLERRHAAKLEPVLPELLHHSVQGDLADKVVAYGLALARRALDAYSPGDARRAAETVIAFVGADAAADPEVEAEARELLALAFWQAGDKRPALDEFDRAIACYQTARDARGELDTMATAAEIAWAARFVDAATTWVERGLELAQELDRRHAADASAPAALPGAHSRLLTLGATLANLRGDTELAAVRLARFDEMRIESSDAQVDLDRGATLRVAIPAAIRATHPVNAATRGDQEVFGIVCETIVSTDAHGILTPNLCSRWDFDDEGKVCRLTIRDDVRMSDGRAVDADMWCDSIRQSIRRCEGELPPAFSRIAGVDEFRSGASESLEGLSAEAATVVVRFVDPLPIFPALLTDTRTALALSDPADPERIVGTGNFTLASREDDRVSLLRSPNPWRGKAANVAAVEITGDLSPEELSSRASSGEVDIVRGLPARDFEELLRDRRRRYRLVEAPAANVWFLVCNRNRPSMQSRELRNALFGIIDRHDVVRTSIGRFAVPAETLVPPGTLGHDPNRRRDAVTHEQITGWLAAAPGPRRLVAFVTPGYRARYMGLVRAMVDAWADYGVTVETVERSGKFDYLLEGRIAESDLLIGGWAADYHDPDAFLHATFHSSSGALRHLMAGDALDALLEQARREVLPSQRERLYARVEESLLADATVLPLFHETEHRIASHRVRRLEIGATPPFVNYSDVGKTSARSVAVSRSRAGGRVCVPIPAGCDLRSLDPSAIRMEIENEILGTIYESLTRNPDGARVVPWLARSFSAENGGRRFRFTLRDDVTFHNGRSLTARDVRYSLERLLRNADSVYRWQLAPIRGAADVLGGTRFDLEGFRIVSRLEFTIDLDNPVSFFPALLISPAAAIVPEGSSPQSGAWREAIGTGPFQVSGFTPGESLELEANPTYWRDGLPRADSLVFSFGQTPAGTAAAFRAGRASIAWDLLRDDEAAFRADPAIAAGYRETASLHTVLLAFNTRRGPLADDTIRHHIVNGLDVDALVRQSVDPHAMVARTIVPPGLLGHDDSTWTSGHQTRQPRLGKDVHVSCLMRPFFADGSNARFRDALFEALAAIGVHATVNCPPREEWEAARSAATDDMFLLGWAADYPDADAFARGLLHSERGWIGNYCGSTDIDRLLDRSLSAVDAELRHDLYREVEAIASRRAMLLPLFHGRSYRFVRPEVRGLEVTLALPYVAYEKLWVRSSR